MEKTVGTRIAECIEIKKQLSQVGSELILSENDTAKLQQAMNAFIKDGVSATLRVHIAPPGGKGPHARIILSMHRQSGMLLEM